MHGWAAGLNRVMPASPLEEPAYARSMSVGSLVLVDKAESSSGQKTQPMPAPASETGEASEEVKVLSSPIVELHERRPLSVTISNTCVRNAQEACGIDELC